MTTMSTGAVAGNLAIVSNDPDKGSFEVALSGVVDAAKIIDNTSATGYRTVSSGYWSTSGVGYSGGHQFEFGGTGGYAEWTIGNLPAGEYRVFATWPEGTNRGTNVPYSVSDGSYGLGTVSVNQRLAPAAHAIAGGRNFQSLGSFSSVSGSLVVRVTNSSGDGRAIADAVRIEYLGPAQQSPEIRIVSGAVELYDSASTVNLGTTFFGTPAGAKTLTVTNSGTTGLILAPLTQQHMPADVTLVASYASTILAPGASTTFQVQLAGTIPGASSGVLSLASNDPDEASFEITLTGTVDAVKVVENGEAGYTTVSSSYWSTTAGYQFEYGATGGYAEWSFPNLPAGEYRISAAWPDDPAWSSIAPYSIIDGTTTLTTVNVNQKLAPAADIAAGGKNFQDLSTVGITNGSLVVRVTHNGANRVVADAIRVQYVGKLPEVQVSDTGAQLVVNGAVASTLDFGQSERSQKAVEVVAVTNTSTSTLSLTQVTQADLPAGFLLVSGFGGSTLAPGASAYARVRLDAIMPGTYSGTILIQAGAQSFALNVTGQVISAPILVDNGDPGFLTTGSGWQNGTAGTGFGDAYLKTSGAATGKTASWTIDGLAAGAYLVYATYLPSAANTAAALYNLYDGIKANNTLEHSATVNQRVAPNGLVVSGQSFGYVSQINVSSTTLTVELDASSLSGGLALADAVYVVPATLGTFFGFSSPGDMVTGSAESIETGFVDPDGDLASSIAVYSDSNGNGVLDVGVDQLLSSDTTPGDGLDFDASTLASGSHRLFVAAMGADGPVANAEANVTASEWWKVKITKHRTPNERLFATEWDLTADAKPVRLNSDLNETWIDAVYARVSGTVHTKNIWDGQDYYYTFPKRDEPGSPVPPVNPNDRPFDVEIQDVLAQRWPKHDRAAPGDTKMIVLEDLTRSDFNDYDYDDQYWIVEVKPYVADLDIDSDSTGDPVERSRGEEQIEESTAVPGKVLAVGGNRAQMIVEVTNDTTATFSISAGADKVTVWSAAEAGVAVLTQAQPAKSVSDLPGGVRGEKTTVWTLWIEATAPSISMADIAFRLTPADAANDPSLIETVRATAIAVDIDTDSNNDGFIDPNNSLAGTDDPIERQMFGRAVYVNDDDDDENGVRDLQDTNQSPAENDLALLLTRELPLNFVGAASLKITYDDSLVRLYRNPNKTGLVVDGGSVPFGVPLFVEGLDRGWTVVTATWNATGETIEDSVLLAVYSSAINPGGLDLDVDSDNVDADEDGDYLERSKPEDDIEASGSLPGKALVFEGKRAKMVVELAAGQTGFLEIIAGSDKVIVWDAEEEGGEILSEETPSRSLTAGTDYTSTTWTYWIEAIDVSETLADIAFQFTTDDGTHPPVVDIVRATSLHMTVQANGIISADDGKLWVYSGVSELAKTLPTDPDLSDDPDEVEFEVLNADGTSTGVIGTAAIVRGFAFTVLTLPDNLLHIGGTSTYTVRAKFRSLTVDSSETVVIPGLADQIDAEATVTFTNRPGFSFNITDSNVPFLRDFAGAGRVTVQATVRDRLGNLVEDGTPVVWGTVDDGFNPDDIANPGTETVDGVASFAINSDRIATVARLSVTADQKTVQGFLSGGALNVSLQLLDPNSLGQWNTIIDLDNRWWYSTQSQSIRLRAIVTRTDGTSVGAGVPVKFHDTKKLLTSDAVLTNASGIAEVDLFVPNDRATWSILGGSVVTASAAGYSDQQVASIVGSQRPPVELEFSNPVLAGNTTTGGTNTLADVNASSGLNATVDVPFAANGTITLRNLTPNASYRLEVPANSPVLLGMPGTSIQSDKVSFQPENSTFVIDVKSQGSLTGSEVKVVKPLLYLESTLWNWFEDPVGYSVKGDGTGTIIVGPASAVSRIGQITQSIVSGGIFGSSGFDASLAGDIGFSLIPGLGLISDVRELGKSLLKLMPIDLGLGPFDWREAAIAGFGILTEIIPPADAIVDAYRAMYKIAKQVPAVMPVFLSVEPLFTKALTSLFSYEPGAAPAAAFAASADGLMSISAASASSGFDDIFTHLVDAIGATNVKRLLTHTDVAKKLKADEAFNTKYLDLARINGSKFADDVFEIGQAFGVDTLVDMVKAADSSLEDFGAGLNAMATAIRRQGGGEAWNNVDLIASLKASPANAAEIFTSFGSVSRKVQEAGQRFGKGVAGESDVSQAIALVIGRTSANGGHSFTKNIDQLRNFSDDLKTITNFDPLDPRDIEKMRSGIALIRRFRSDVPGVPTQAGRLFEVQEVAAALRADPDTVISFNKFVDDGLVGKTDVDVLLNGKAIELKLTVNAADDEAIIKKFVKYYNVPEAAQNLELRSLSTVAEMTAYVQGAFQKYIAKDRTDWPGWLTRAVTGKESLARVLSAISYAQMPASRYNFFAAAGGL
jgi:hypothetical protein